MSTVATRNESPLTSTAYLADYNYCRQLKLQHIWQERVLVVEFLLARGLYLAEQLQVLLQQSRKGFGRMRNALFNLSIIGMSLVPTLGLANPLEMAQTSPVLCPVSPSVSSPVSVYAPQLSPTPDLDQQLLPIRGSELPLSTAATGNGTASTGPQASVVEAIPTPTAFHAGGLLIIAMIAVRYFRKLRVN